MIKGILLIILCISILCLICYVCINKYRQKIIINEKTRDLLKFMPVPRKRFTYIKKHKVEMNEEDLHELLVYVAELEDYFERIGKL